MNLVENIRSAFSNAKSRNERDWAEYNSILQRADDPKPNDGERLAALAQAMNIAPDALEREVSAAVRRVTAEKAADAAQARAAQAIADADAAEALRAETTRKLQREIALAKGELAALDRQMLDEKALTFRGVAAIGIVIAQNDISGADRCLRAAGWTPMGTGNWRRSGDMAGVEYTIWRALTVELLFRATPVISELTRRANDDLLNV